MEYYIIYKITNILNNKFYIGKHKTKNINDSYMGSGIVIKSAILKYGKENFKKEILYILNSEEEMNKKEKEIVNTTLIEDENCYNLTIGGVGGFSKEIAKIGYENSLKKLSSEELSKNGKKGGESLKLKDPDYFKKLGSKTKGKKKKPRSAEHCKKISIALKGKPRPKRVCKKNNYPKTRKLRDTLEKKYVTCPHCNKNGNILGMKRWHFDNCRPKYEKP